MTVLLLGIVLTASPGTDTLAEAEAAYRTGIDLRADGARARPYFARAAEAYEAAWADGTHSPAVARNRAQSRYLAGDLGGSIREYRRGLREFPHDRELRAGLVFARSQVAYPHVGDVAEAARPREAESV